MCPFNVYFLQGVASARDVLFPSRGLRKELEAAQQRMAQLEEELEQVKKAKRRRRSRVSKQDQHMQPQ